MPAWIVTLKESVIDDLRALGRARGRVVLKAAAERLASDPLTVTRNLKSLRPNRVAHRELRLFGRYRVLFTIDEAEKTVSIVLVGEKRGNSLYVQGERFRAHESDSTERS
jgi:mRNA-degrading endonuclease RelE of RelBE toxin-antitoxin system